MRPSEVLWRAREAALRMREIGREIAELEDRIGVQGHGCEPTPKNFVSDPMDRVLDKIDGTAELERERAGLQLDVNEAWSIVAGIESFGNADMAEVVTRYYIYGEDDEEIASVTLRRTDAGGALAARRAAKVCRDLRKQALALADGIGLAKMKGAVGYE